MARKVMVIPSKAMIPTAKNTDEKTPKKRVAAYARVSTDSEEQMTSYDAQVSYYTDYIKSRSDWEFVSVYADEGISGCNTAKREAFNRMISDALDGKIDLIITKSVSRFARNTVDSLTTVRKLKEKGIEIYFQKENIYTLDSKGELLITIMSSLAQEESRSISENVTWGQRKRMADGKVTLPYSNFLGYKKGTDGLPEIVPEEAETVRLIYRSFINGMTPYHIAKMLMEKRILSPRGKLKWSASTVKSILTNEKYKGSALLQKTFTVDFLTKKKKINEGEVPQYYVENSHQAIIEPDEFELVQAEIARRKATEKYYHSKNPFAARIICSECGGFYGSKVWHSSSKYRRVIWQCNEKYRKDMNCTTPHLDENEIKEKFLTAYNRLFSDRESVMNLCKAVLQTLYDHSRIDIEIAGIKAKMEAVADKVKYMISVNSRIAQVQSVYAEEYERLVKEYDALESEVKKLYAEKAERTEKGVIIDRFMHELSERENLLVEFDEHLWIASIEKVTVFPDKKMKFLFKNGSEIEI
ncbi:MAG: recombinase family protein [Clostridium sp.]|nr:recombinase family protein [Clostridium sp.]